MTVFSNDTAYSEGWGLFECDDGFLRIQRLDDPQSVNESYPLEPVFDSDDAAIVYVVERGRQGSAYHAIACAMHNTLSSPTSV